MVSRIAVFGFARFLVGFNRFYFAAGHANQFIQIKTTCLRQFPQLRQRIGTLADFTMVDLCFYIFFCSWNSWGKE